MDNDFARLSYEASLRSLDKQEGLLDELRARTGLLIAASSLAASFLGQPALAHAGTALVVLALLAFALSVGSSLYVLMPKRGLVFSLAGSVLYEGLFDFRDDMAEVYRRVTYELDRFWESNDVRLQRLFLAFRVAAIALGVEVVLLLASVADNLS